MSTYQIGDGHTDHNYWGRPEDMNMTRPCMKVTTGEGGEDIAGEWAAAMAVGYLVFKDKGGKHQLLKMNGR